MMMLYHYFAVWIIAKRSFQLVFWSQVIGRSLVRRRPTCGYASAKSTLDAIWQQLHTGAARLTAGFAELAQVGFQVDSML
jgi:X-X-X-Leu-X-X-Gly heptad repeat protein